MIIDSKGIIAEHDGERRQKPQLYTFASRVLAVVGQKESSNIKRKVSVTFHCYEANR